MRYFSNSAQRVINILIVTALSVATQTTAYAQCAMCRAAVGNSTEASKVAAGWNLAVLVLLVPPLLMFCAFFVLAYRFRKAPGEAAEAMADTTVEADPSPRAYVDEDKNIASGRVRRSKNDDRGPLAEAT